ncbi:efflux RND transporter periplasmic adaptor subunit [Catellatospora sp. KI3]|uniref:efflux RND transporter periplasmic adaptor subunit n=1 Tax=Catellatospora sp. KI3 TaxID=3041620 RepID=UPI002482E21C|nr:efflux RND transporter periplasmic adaptor subunit [Catellatospora sp. KI3]MDI1464451.1 efflux RND transporter periplasmic adaptor subunit [Catellatospora sp. KI3]
MTRASTARRAVLGLTAATLPFTMAAAAVEEPDPAIVLDEVRRASVSEFIDVPAQVAARNSATLRAPARGVLVELTVQPGQFVHRGEVLGRIESPLAMQRLALARQAASRVKDIKKITPADLHDLIEDRKDNDQNTIDFYRDLAELLIPPGELRDTLLEELDEQEDLLDDTIDDLDEFADDVRDNLKKLDEILVGLNAVTRLLTQSAAEAAQNTVDALTLVAPIDGTVQPGGPESNSVIAGLLADRLPQGPLASLLPSITGIDVGVGGTGEVGVNDTPEVGDPVTAGRAIVTVVDTTELSLVGEIDETDVLNVKNGDEATVSIEAAPGARFNASITSIDVLPTRAARGGVSYRTKFAFNGELDPVPLPGMSAVAHLPVGDTNAKLSVPTDALFTKLGQSFVWLVRAGKAVAQAVKIGAAGDGRTEILEGLAEGDQVVAAGLEHVREGMTVE